MQLIFGRKDVKIYVKYRGEGTPFRQVSIEDFTDKVPPFNHSIKWRRQEDKPPQEESVETTGNPAHWASQEAGQSC